ncbi:hypothetical protein [Enterobacter cloacae complex sp. 418I7]|uniref:hypothetical protein n=1 Tax=Enterobacter cloacae complex sp. 418I7 TaxID=3395839 RepID=UPI003CF28011
MKLSDILKKRFNADVIIICDDHGTGKTTLCNEIERNLKGHEDILVFDEYLGRSIGLCSSIEEINEATKETIKDKLMIISACKHEPTESILYGINYKKLLVRQGRDELSNILTKLASEEKSIIKDKLIVDGLTDSKMIKRRL